jgi:hypothetical protein
VCNIVDTYFEGMIITEENQYFYLQAMKVDFLDKAWEREWYTLALMRAAAWGKKIDKENKEYFSKNHLTDKYNV